MNTMLGGRSAADARRANTNATTRSKISRCIDMELLDHALIVRASGGDGDQSFITAKQVKAKLVGSGTPAACKGCG